MEDYVSSLSTFIDLAMPRCLQPELHASLNRYTDNRHPRLYLKAEKDRLPGLGEEAGTRNIWQTDANSEHEESEPVASWKNNDEGWKWKLLNDAEASRYVAKKLDGSRLKTVWDLLPSGILVRSFVGHFIRLMLTNPALVSIPICFDTCFFCSRAGYTPIPTRDDLNPFRIGAIKHDFGMKVVDGCMGTTLG